MIGAIEKQKFAHALDGLCGFCSLFLNPIQDKPSISLCEVYILNRDSAARLTISSPLEAHKSSALSFECNCSLALPAADQGYTLVYAMVGMDVGFENPLFASIELSYEEAGNGSGWRC